MTARETAKVFCVDFGNRSTVAVEDVRPLPARFAQQAALAYRCALEDAPDGLVGATDALAELAESETFSVRVARVEAGVLHVRLATSGGLDVVQLLSGERPAVVASVLEPQADSVYQGELVWTEAFRKH